MRLYYVLYRFTFILLIEYNRIFVNELGFITDQYRIRYNQVLRMYHIIIYIVFAVAMVDLRSIELRITVKFTTILSMYSKYISILCNIPAKK